jgi:hypothetical protein
VNEALAVTFLVVGIIAGSWAVLMWMKKRGHARNWVILLMVLFGMGVGVGLGALFNVNILYYKVGLIPAWVIPAAIAGFAFILEIKGWRDHHTRTPILGAIVALIVAAAVGQTLAAAATHGIDKVQVTSNITHHPKG